MRIVPAAVMDRVSDALFRVARWRRQLRLIEGDPLALDPRVEPHAQQLKFTHVYTAAHAGETARWLTSPVYAAEAAKSDPIDICHLAIDRFHVFLEHGDVSARDDFLAITRGLLDSGRVVALDGRTCFVIPHLDQVEGYARHRTPWVNAMVQGWVGALFMRAHQLTGAERFAEAAIRAVGVCFVPVERGGVRDLETNRRVFYEKYALPGQTRHVLNGFMSALMGIWDVARASGNADAHAAFESGVASLDDVVLDTYDTGYTTLYDQRPDRRATPSSVLYTWVHARQLAVLARITQQPRLLRWADRWRSYSRRTEHRVRTTLDTVGYRARSLGRYIGLDHS
ncbi:MAG TPA: D-glucuronyl C5-epimerase family protein [Kofleriaceae bacterium]|nr:D-glucuronyl C5-epimerase family protein [Kofleriaceae bacterium]